MATALRRGLNRARGEPPGLPAHPYDALFAGWDRLPQQAATEDDALERFFPAQFAESHWDAADPYSRNPQEDARAGVPPARMAHRAFKPLSAVGRG